MDPLYIEESDTNPKVVLDKDKGIFEISGRSNLENAISFYEEIMDWLDEYSRDPLEETIFNFKLEYYNSASSKVFLDVLKTLDSMYQDGIEVAVYWHHLDDEMIEEEGEIYSEMVDVPIHIVNWKPK